MPRKMIMSPGKDSVGSLLSHVRDPFQVDKWKVKRVGTAETPQNLAG
jgi:hypothetical protein